jgi:large subunit ribosomal protein L17
MLRNLLTSLVEHEKISTTHIRGKVLKKEMDKLIAIGKKGTLHARRQVAAVLYTDSAVAKLCNVLAPRYVERKGGCTRIIPLGPRRGDAAEVCIVQLLPGEAAPASAKPEEGQAKAEAKAEAKAAPAAEPTAE